MKTFFTCVLILLIFSFSHLNAQQQCSAHFIHYTLNNTPADSVHFYADSSGRNSANTKYYWDFGDGVKGFYTLNPWHTYVPGDYNACLTVRDSTSAGLCYNTHCDSVHVGGTPPPPPVCHAHFVHYSLNSNCDSVHFYIDSASTVGNIKYYWTFGDGTTSTRLNPWHVYAAGNYQACLIVRDSSSAGLKYCNFCDSVHVCPTTTPPPPVCHAHFVHYSRTTNCDSVYFFIDSASTPGNIKYYWTFGDGTTSNIQNQWHLYANAGNYQACVTVRDSSAAGLKYCNYCDSIHVCPTTPPPPPPHQCSAHFIHYRIANKPDSVHFYPDSTNLNSANTKFYWDFGDGNKGFFAANPWHKYAPGNYYACLTVRDSTIAGLCYNTFCDSIHISGNPPPPPPHQCSAHFNGYILLNHPDSVHFFSDSTLHNSPNTKYSWDFGDGITGLFGQDIWHKFATGTYKVCLTVRDSGTAGLCYNTYCDSVSICNSSTTPPPPPVQCSAHFTHYNSPHNADSIHFIPATNPPGTSYFWDFGDGTSSANHDPWHYFRTGSYKVCLTIINTAANIPCKDVWCDYVYPPLMHPIIFAPNPVSSNTLVTVTQVTAPETLFLYDAIGREVFRKEISADESFLIPAALVSGLYSYRLDSASGTVDKGSVMVVE